MHEFLVSLSNFFGVTGGGDVAKTAKEELKKRPDAGDGNEKADDVGEELRTDISGINNYIGRWIEDADWVGGS